MSMPLNLALRRTIVSPYVEVFLVYLTSHVYMAVTGYVAGQGLDVEFPRSFCRWDCRWYLEIARHGYHLLPPESRDFQGQANWGFFPFFPLLARFVNYALHINYFYAALIVANLSFLVGVLALYRYVERTEGHTTAMFAATLACFSPYAVYFAVPYTEATFFALSVLTFIFARDEKWLLAGACAVLLGATRNTGVLMVFPLFLIAAGQYGIKDLLTFRAKGGRPSFALLLAPLGLFLFMLFLYGHVGDALAFKNVQVSFERIISNPLAILGHGLLRFPHLDFYFAVVTLFGFAIAAFLAAKRRYAEALFIVTAILPPLTTALYAMPRYTLTLFPIFVGMALLFSGHRLARTLILAASIGANLYFVIAWINELPLMM